MSEHQGNAGTIFKLRLDGSGYRMLTDSNFFAVVGYSPPNSLAMGGDGMIYGTSDSAIFKLGPVGHDSLLAMHQNDASEHCFFVSLERHGPNRPLKLRINTQKGHQTLDSVDGALPERSNFLAFALCPVDEDVIEHALYR